MTYKKENTSLSLGRKEIFIFEGKTQIFSAHPFLRNGDRINLVLVEMK